MVLATTSTLVCPCGRVGSGIVTEPHHASDGYFVHVCVELRLSVVVDPFEGIDPVDDYGGVWILRGEP